MTSHRRTSGERFGTRVIAGIAIAIAMAPSAARAAELPVVAVFGIQDTRTAKLRLSTDDLVSLTDYLAGKISSGGAFQRVADNELKEKLAGKKKASYDMCYDTSCQIEIGKELAANKTLATKIAAVGKTCYVQSTLWDLKRGTSELTADEECACDVDAIRVALKTIAGRLTSSANGGARPTAETPQTTSVTTVKKDPGLDTSDLARLQKEADAARAEEARRAEEAERARAAEVTAWATVKSYAGTDAIDLKKRIAELEGFIAKLRPDSSVRTEAESTLAELKNGGGKGDMVLVPAGSFLMGCNDQVDVNCEAGEKPGRQVNVGTFRIDRLEVSVEAYAKCVRAGGCSSRGLEMPLYDGKEQPEYASYCNWNKAGKEKHPMNCVDWDQATTYCRWAKKRLPTEAEWEKAARGTDGRKFPWGNSGYDVVRKVANISDETAKKTFTGFEVVAGYDDGYVGTAPVGSYPAGASPYGALDMIGNVSEWTSSWHTEGQKRALRGGSWGISPTAGRASVLGGNAPEVRGVYIGFRCAAD